MSDPEQDVITPKHFKQSFPFFGLEDLVIQFKISFLGGDFVTILDYKTMHNRCGISADTFWEHLKPTVA